ncbi:MAG: AAA family ATPase [Treponemataceae bacterium]|nr:AAA family ATPase [Treponemataceae bacterium]
MYMSSLVKSNQKYNYPQDIQGKNKANPDPLKDFYFHNTYPKDGIKADKMLNNVRSDLKPFSDYIRTSIDYLQKSATEGADVVIAKTEEAYLVPQFTMIKPILPKNQFEVEKPCNVYVLSAEEDFDTESFEVIHRRDEICTFKNMLDSYGGKVFVRISKDNEQVKSNKKFDLYDKDKDESIKCTIEPVSYNDPATYRIEGIAILSVEELGDKLIFSTEKDVTSLKEITLFNNDTLPIIRKPSHEKTIITAKNNVPIKQIPNSAYYALDSKQDDIHIFVNNAPIKHNVVKLEELPERELQELLHSNDVFVQNGRLIYRGNEKDSVSFGDLKFRIKSEKSSLKRRFKDKAGKFVGTVIEILANDKTTRDLESNTDIFFKETTEKLTDRLPYRPNECRTFEIGRIDENQSLMEIAEKKNGQLQKVTERSLPKHLFAVPNTWQLTQQQSALGKLQKMPCREQEKLLELFERKSENGKSGATWEWFQKHEVSEWFLLTKDEYEGCSEQREFVQRALATPDFAFLDGPPGSGKTTSILELIAQLVMQGKKILLTASTNAAVDNILERLEKLPEEVRAKILAVRIGNESSISDTVQEYTLSDVPQNYHEEISMRANVVCATIFGVLKHPAFKLKDRNQPVRPLYDYLIIDEASKTTFQDFLVPALYSRHWILSGDLKQLTPYVEQGTIQSSLEEIPEFDRNFQHIQTILQLAKENGFDKKNAKFYTVITANQINAAEQLITKDGICGVITKQKSTNPYIVSMQEINEASPKAVILWGARFLLVEDSILKEIQYCLPASFIPLDAIESSAKNCSTSFLVATAQASFAKVKSIELGTRGDKGNRNNLKEIAAYWKNALKEHSWAKEITWRLCRIQELFLDAKDGATVKKYKEQIEQRIPSFKTIDGKEIIKTYCNAIAGIALPSILQLLQNGLNEDVRTNFKPTTLNNGFESEDFNMRHTMLTYQHRMHPSISAFSAEHIYNGKALKDGSELDENRSWDCPTFGKKHSVWLDTESSDSRSNENPEEIKIIKEQLRKFMDWAKDNPPNQETGTEKNWTVACLTYYKKQERRLKEAIKQLFGEQKEKSWYKSDEKHIEVFIYTVDKFQGREADVVFLSLVKSGKVSLGFMDSPNRLNVALTRARYQRIIVGNRKYFKGTNKSKLLNSLAENESI